MLDTLAVVRALSNAYPNVGQRVRVATTERYSVIFFFPERRRAQVKKKKKKKPSAGMRVDINENKNTREKMSRFGRKEEKEKKPVSDPSLGCSMFYSACDIKAERRERKSY